MPTMPPRAAAAAAAPRMAPRAAAAGGALPKDPKSTCQPWCFCLSWWGVLMWRSAGERRGFGGAGVFTTEGHFLPMSLFYQPPNLAQRAVRVVGKVST